MGGFKNESNNIIFESGFVNTVIAHLTKCSKKMMADCIDSGISLRNKEDAITNKLVANYLNAEPDNLRYEPQSLENYDDESGNYTGRTDIRVISADYFCDAQAYHIIECKRIDGSYDLNWKYVSFGVARFFNPVPKPKYSSYYNRNIMFGYVVKDIYIPDNANKIDRLQHSLLMKVSTEGFVLKQHDDPQYYVYFCEYDSEYLGRIELRHLFFNFSDIINNEN